MLLDTFTFLLKYELLLCENTQRKGEYKYDFSKSNRSVGTRYECVQ